MTQNIVPNQNSRVKNINRAFLFIITQLAIFVSQSDVFDWYYASTLCTLYALERAATGQTSPPPPLLATPAPLTSTMYRCRTPYTFRRHGAPLQWDGTTQTPAAYYARVTMWASFIV